MKIGLFGGSFNPIHNGHIRIAKQAYAELKLDKLIFIPAATNPFKKGQKNLPWEHRVKMIELAIENCTENFEISLYEIKKGGLSYTYQTIDYYANKFKGDQLYFIIGSDSLPDLHKWEFIEQSTQKARFVVFARDAKINKTNIKRFNVLQMQNIITPESSTAIRHGVLSYTPLKVNEYIGQNRLFAKEIVHLTLTALRAKHSVAAAEFAAKLAKSQGLSYNQGYYAGLFHDICKEVDENNSRQFITSFGLNGFDKNEFPRHKLHQVCGALWLKNVYKINDDEIVKAVSIHTTMSLEMSLLDKILFIADKICDGRAFKGVQKLRKLVFENFDEGFKQVVRCAFDYNTQKGVVFDKLQEQIYQKWMN